MKTTKAWAVVNGAGNLVMESENKFVAIFKTEHDMKLWGGRFGCCAENYVQVEIHEIVREKRVRFWHVRRLSIRKPKEESDEPIE